MHLSSACPQSAACGTNAGGVCTLHLSSACPQSAACGTNAGGVCTLHLSSACPQSAACGMQHVRACLVGRMAPLHLVRSRPKPVICFKMSVGSTSLFLSSNPSSSASGTPTLCRTRRSTTCARATCNVQHAAHGRHVRHAAIRTAAPPVREAQNDMFFRRSAGAQYRERARARAMAGILDDGAGQSGDHCGGGDHLPFGVKPRNVGQIVL